MTSEQRKLEEEQIKNNFSELQKKLEDLKNEVQTESDDSKKQEKNEEIQKLEKELSEMKSLIEETGADTEQLSCVKNLVSDFGKNSSTTAQLYNKYPFVTSTNENVTITSKQNPIYELGLDSENFTNYFNEVQNTEIATSLYDCLDVKKSEDLSENDVAAMVKKLPKIYAEVNSANNFTRLYTTSDINNGMATVTVDFGFSYPSSVNVSEPSEYKNLIDFIQDLANSTSSSSSSKKK